VIAYRATLDMPRDLAQFVASLLAERHRRGAPRGSRALACFWEAVLGLRWFRDRTSPDALARDHGISRATAYRYLDEVTTVLAAQAPDLHEALERTAGEGGPQRERWRAVGDAQAEGQLGMHPPGPAGSSRRRMGSLGLPVSDAW
jgi:hypothetical protein